MKRNVAICARSIVELSATRPETVSQGPEKYFCSVARPIARQRFHIMDLGDAVTAMHDVKLANIYFCIAAGLTSATANYHAAALANVRLTSIQLQTLNRDPVLAARRTAHFAQTAYHKL